MSGVECIQMKSVSISRLTLSFQESEKDLEKSSELMHLWLKI